MPNRPLQVAIIGAGIGGLTAAACLRRTGIGVRIYEQARGFTRLGAGIQQAPNAIRVLYALGLRSQLLAQAFQPDSNDSRHYDTGALTNSFPLGETIRQHHGVPYYLNHRLAGIAHARDGGVHLTFTNGETAEADTVIGADGIHSIVRESLLGREAPRFTGRVAYRAVFPTALLNGLAVEDCVKWWGPDRHMVSYFVNPRRDELYFVTSTPEPEFNIESWSAKGNLATLRAAYDTFHPQVGAILAACPDVHKWALVEREPLPHWVEGNVALLGDACHPMTPYMAQGASTSIEDGAILARCLNGVDRDGVHTALLRYEATRKPRTSRIQMTSAQNTWLKHPHDADWVYGYDAWTAPLAD
jgi:6-hydroxynicotinate 3-monooxygenase